MDLATMRARVRKDLHDEDSGNYRWVDATLDRHIARAVGELSLVAPAEVKTTLTTTAGSREISLTTLTPRVGIVSVEYPVGEYPPSMPRFAVWGDTLALRVEDAPAGVEDVAVRWGKLHTLDGSGTTIPDRLHDLVAVGAAGYAAVEWANFAINRVNVGGPEVVALYRDWGREQLQDFAAALVRVRDGAQDPLPAKRIGLGQLVSLDD